MNSASLEARLAALAAAGETITYGELARELGLRMGALTAALEALMQIDAAAGQPLRAAVLCARGTTLPARGFYDAAAELGFDITDRSEFANLHRARLHSGS